MCPTHHSLVSCDLLGVSVEESDFDGLPVRRDLLPGSVGKDNKAVATGQNLFYLEKEEPEFR